MAKKSAVKPNAGPSGKAVRKPRKPAAKGRAWVEPDAPPSDSAHLDLDTAQTRVGSLLLRANIPSTITLRGPADLAFANMTVVITAKPLVRNLAQEFWGTRRSSVTEPIAGTQFGLAGTARIDAVGVKRPYKSALKLSPAVEVQSKAPTGWTPLIAALPLSVVGDPHPVNGVGIDWLSGLKEQGFETDSVTLSVGGGDVSVLLRSPSLPSRVAVAVGDDSPVQVFPAQMAEGGTLSTRDLTPQLSAAWHSAAAAAGVDGAERIEVKLRVTSMTDGVVSLDLVGTWGELYETPASDIVLSPLEPAALVVLYPLAGSGAVASLRLKGELRGGKRLGLVTGPPGFVVRVTERLEVAQSFLLAKQAGTAAARQVSAVWLLLPKVVATPTEVELRLVAAAGDPPVPGDEVLARTLARLPADSAAYQESGDGVWFRAAFPDPISLNGTQVRQPLFIVAAGRGEGVRLGHRSTGALPADPGVGRIPTDAGKTGAALVRNLERSGSWELQSFNRQSAVWLMDLELLPLPAEYPGLVTVTFPGGSPQEVGFAGAGESMAKGLLAAAQAGSAVVVALRSCLAGKLTWQMQLYRAITG